MTKFVMKYLESYTMDTILFDGIILVIYLEDLLQTLTTMQCQKLFICVGIKVIWCFTKFVRVSCCVLVLAFRYLGCVGKMHHAIRLNKSYDWTIFQNLKRNRSDFITFLQCGEPSSRHLLFYVVRCKTVLFGCFKSLFRWNVTAISNFPWPFNLLSKWNLAVLLQ